MKRRILTILTAIMICVSAVARETGDRINILSTKISEQDSSVTVTFIAEVGTKAVRRNRTVIFQPVLEEGGYRVSLPVLRVDGRGSKAARARREWAAGTASGYHLFVQTRNGRRIEYIAMVPAQQWMHGATLTLEAVESGCCVFEPLPDLIIAQDIYLWEDPQVEEFPADTFLPEPTTGELLAADFDFVLPWTEFDESEPFRIYDDERDNGIIIYFRQSRSDIDHAYMTNRQMTANLLAAVGAIRQSDDSEVKRIVIGGFASPEGSYEFNDRLAFDRAVAVKQLIIENTGVPGDDIILHNGSVDWRGLRLMVEKSNLPEKRQVLDIIDNYPVWDPVRQVGRHGQLMRLNRGETYRYLLREYFPYLRNGAFIKVYYDTKK